MQLLCFWNQLLCLLRLNPWLMYFACTLLAACATQPIQSSDKHIQQGGKTNQAVSIPQPVKPAISLPPPAVTPKIETYSVVVVNVPAQEILFALARDAKINLDIHAGIQGTATLNAIDQTLPQILNRIARQVDMRYELDGQNLIVMPDTPYLKHYKIDYVNMARDSEGATSDSTHIGSGAAAGAAGSAVGAGSAGNNSSLAIKNISKNHFWETLTQNIKDILRETDKILPSGSSETMVQQSSAISTSGTGVQQPLAGVKKSVAKMPGIENSPIPATLQEGGTTVTRTNTFREAASVIANPESGIVTVRATGKQHEKIQEFVDQVMTSVRRQVLIEATVVEVLLSDNYKQGIEWSALRFGAAGFNLAQKGTTGLPSNNALNIFTLDYANPNSPHGNLSAQVSLLESFGTVKVLSSPKLSVMNNQTAMLRVVDNKVYFIVNSATAPCAPAPCTPIITYTTTVNTVPIGFTMSVTPQINDSDTVLLNIRPSITRLLKNANDPTPGLSIPNTVPQTSTREMESVLKIENNQIAVLGGLMEDRMDEFTDEVPLLGRIPLLGNLFQNRNDTATKTELVIFLRPVVIKDASVNGDYGAFRDSLPNAVFFKQASPNQNLSSQP